MRFLQQQSKSPGGEILSPGFINNTRAKSVAAMSDFMGGSNLEAVESLLRMSSFHHILNMFENEPKN